MLTNALSVVLTGSLTYFYSSTTTHAVVETTGVTRVTGAAGVTETNGGLWDSNGGVQAGVTTPVAAQQQQGQQQR